MISGLTTTSRIASTFIALPISYIWWIRWIWMMKAAWTLPSHYSWTDLIGSTRIAQILSPNSESWLAFGETDIQAFDASIPSPSQVSSLVVILLCTDIACRRCWNAWGISNSKTRYYPNTRLHRQVLKANTGRSASGSMKDQSERKESPQRAAWKG